jgi:hypothetical protein
LASHEIRSRPLSPRDVGSCWTSGHGSTRSTTLHSPADWHPESSDNARSPVLDIEHGGRHLLLTGDLDQLGLIELIDGPRIDSPIDLMLAPTMAGGLRIPLCFSTGPRPVPLSSASECPPLAQPMPLVPWSGAVLPCSVHQRPARSIFGGRTMASSLQDFWMDAISQQRDPRSQENALTPNAILLAVAGVVGASSAPHHGGKSANTSMLYNLARPRAVVVSQRTADLGATDALTPLERSGIPLLRTRQRGAVHYQWANDRIVTSGFLDQREKPPARP